MVLVYCDTLPPGTVHSSQRLINKQITVAFLMACSVIANLTVFMKRRIMLWTVKSKKARINISSIVIRCPNLSQIRAV
jgi:hypothetical protein